MPLVKLPVLEYAISIDLLSVMAYTYFVSKGSL
jgi:hypothetical protein